MTLWSAYEDFVERTLASVRTRWRKLEYIRGLRTEEKYVHWGLARVHGDAVAETAIAQAHTDVWIDVLRTPLNVLLSELEEADRDGSGPEDYLHRLETDVVIPRELNGGSVRHFNSILLALSLLAQAERERSHRAA